MRTHHFHLISRSRAAFSLVELLAVVSIIGLITFLAFPKVTQMRSDGERNLAIARAEALNMAMANLVQVRGRLTANQDWTTGANDTGRYDLVKPYLGFAESSLTLYMPSGYDVDFPTSLEPLQKVTLKDPSATRIYY